MEHAGSTDLTGATLTFVGDIQNNVTYDLMRAGTIMGMTVRCSCSTKTLHHTGLTKPLKI